ncbi:hypothetical protein Ahy_B10g102157 [Arachis hypogaea]|uniref:Ethylene insensitive 3-like DNA-binding domain-containing protein n=1 Tax=Arachis hypogaea TaxID=3818 RepID=A0A444X1J9_ARAHY|nr:hypothetical protein Ahy_B10g102157 [Arachis hypogaea]
MVLIQEEMDPSYVQLTNTEDEEIDATLTAEDETIDYEVLKKRIWKDRVLLQKMKEKFKKDESENKEAKQEASRKKKMSRAQDSVLKYMVKIMKVCKARGFVYGIVPEKGKPDEENNKEDDEGETEVFESSSINSINNSLDHVLFGGGGSSSTGDSEKRKCNFDSNNNDNSFVDKLLYTCQNIDCPQSHLSMGFRDKNSRMDHESMCAFRSANHQGSNSSNKNSKAFHDYPSNCELLAALEMVKANSHDHISSHDGHLLDKEATTSSLWDYTTTSFKSNNI